MKNKIRHLFHQRHLLHDFVGRDLLTKYVGSAGGVLWSVIHPLALLLVYTFVFSVVLKVRLGEEGTVTGFALYLYCGMLPWHAFADAIGRSTPTLVQHRNLIKNVRFPAKLLPTSVVLSELVNEAIGLVLLVGAVLVLGGTPSWSLLLLPPLLVLQIAFTLGLSFALCTVHVFFRDAEHVVRVGLMLWMFLTPIFYPESQVPESLRWLVKVNPMAYLVRMYRTVILERQLFALSDLALFAASATAAFVVGYALFTRNHHKLADLL
jgi:ABC-type polysaccharide/polyol phosphate export permease